MTLLPAEDAPRAAINAALQLIATVPGYAGVARDLRRTFISVQPTLSDRAQTTLRGTIILGPEPFAASGSLQTVSLAATLIHEHAHLQQHPLLKTASFWHGIAHHLHPMRRYELPAYKAQLMFLRATARAMPALAFAANAEADAVRASFVGHYGYLSPDAPD